MSSSSSVSSVVDKRRMEDEEEIELEWEEWDGKSPFVHHCIAGSIAGVAEHTLLYPVDTVKTYMQSYCADCPKHASPSRGATFAKTTTTIAGTTFSHHQHQPGMWNTLQTLVVNKGSIENGPTLGSTTAVSWDNVRKNATAKSAPGEVERGFLRLWRGVKVMAAGCIPAHALYFSSYEAVKAIFLSSKPRDTPATLGPVGSAAAGATAAFFHDLVMTPVDTIKQRMQLGHYQGSVHAVRHILQNEGRMALYRSFPITLLTNIPYAMVMVTTNEWLRAVLMDRRYRLHPSASNQPMDLQTCLLAGCGAGALAAAVTTPLDRIKTRLQTQSLGVAADILRAEIPSTTCSGAAPDGTCPKTRTEAAALARASARRLTAVATATTYKIPKYNGFLDAFRSIVREEGYLGLLRGLTPRLLTHTPSVAISWTCYESAKNWLAVAMPS